ncbi:hypothetical protein [Chlorobium phaeobacteroides]|nr:hypothetical protein [Chlorobium phaeobacteroides]
MRKQNISGVMSFFSLFVMYYVSVSLLLFDFGKDMPFGFNRYIYDDILIYGTLVVLLSCIFYDIGFNLGKNKFIIKALDEKNDGLLKDILFSIISIVPVLFLIEAFDFAYLLRRGFYSSLSSNVVYVKYADIFAYISMLLTPQIYSKYLRRVVFVMVFMIFAAIGSRMAILYAMAYLFIRMGVNFNRDSSIRFKYYVYLFFFLLLGVNIYIMRSGSVFGFVGFIESIWYFGFSLFYEMFKFLNFSINCSVITIGRYVVDPDINYYLFLQSLNPLPGFLLPISQGDIDAWARFRKNIPYSGLSQVYVHLGPIFSSIVFFLIGRINKYFVLMFSVYSNGKYYVNKLLYHIVAIMGGIPLLVGFQFNIRTVTRVYYAVWFIALLVIFLKKFKIFIIKTV